MSKDPTEFDDLLSAIDNLRAAVVVAQRESRRGCPFDDPADWRVIQAWADVLTDELMGMGLVDEPAPVSVTVVTAR
jgi:hypothetical protein